MRAQISEVEALLVSKKAVRVEAAKTELARTSSLSLGSFIWAAPMLLAAIFGDPLAHYYGISTQLFILLCVLFGGVIVSAAQIVSLQRKVSALTELIRAQDERNGDA